VHWFRGDYSFVQVPSLLNARQQPLEKEGLTEALGSPPRISVFNCFTD
jgi:hypothetical protein